MTSFLVTKSDFTLFSGRKHVLGACILDQMSRALIKTQRLVGSSDLHVKMIKFKKKTSCDGDIVVKPVNKAPENVAEAVSEMSANFQGKNFHCWFVPAPNKTILKNAEMDICLSEFSSSGSFSGGCSLVSRNRGETLRALVEATKQIQLLSKGVLNHINGNVVSELLFIEDCSLGEVLNSVNTYLDVKNLGSRVINNRLTTLNMLEFLGSDQQVVKLKIAMSFHSTELL